MANPNIISVSDIRGKTASLAVTTSATALVTAASNKVFKINSLYVANVDGVTSADITVEFYDSSTTTSFKLASTIAVPPDSTLVVIDKNSGVYLEEGDELRVTASANGDLVATASYEEIS